MKRLIILFCISLVCSTSVFSNEKLSINILKIDTKKVTLEVLNSGTQKTVFQYIAVVKYENNRWVPARGTITCPCKAKCAKRVFRLKPHQSLSFAWDGKSPVCDLLYGTFRFVIFKYKDPSMILAQSQRFVLGKR